MNPNEQPLTLPENPIAAVKTWMNDAVIAKCPEPTAMTLATCDERGRPAARVVLLKGIAGDAFQFFTNYDSRKARELSAHPWAALVLLWQTLARQVRIEGRVERLTPEESETYFRTRPRGSQIGAWSSPQSREIKDRDELVRLVKSTEEKFQGKEVPCPPFWGGFQVVPEAIEFWEGRPSRLHERFLYVRQDEGWRKTRLAP